MAVTYGSPFTVQSIAAISCRCDQLSSGYVRWMHFADSTKKYWSGVISFSSLSASEYYAPYNPSAAVLWSSGPEDRLALCKISSTNFFTGVVNRSLSGTVVFILHYGNDPYFVPNAGTAQIIGGYVDLANVETSKAIAIYTDFSVGYVQAGYGYGASTRSWGTRVAITSAGVSLTNSSICKIAEDKFIISYKNSVDGKGYCICGTVPAGLNSAGLVITMGTAVEFYSGTIYETSIISPDDDKFIIFFDTGMGGYTVCGTVSTRTITIGTSFTSVGNSGHAYNPRLAVLSNTSCAVCVFQDVADSNKGKLNIISADFNNLTTIVGNLSTFSSNSIGGGTLCGLDICSINTHDVAIVYLDADDSYKTKIIAAFIQFIFIPNPPENVSSDSSWYRNNISWDASTGADTYNIYWKWNTEDGYRKISNITDTAYLHAPLDANEKYTYYVTAENEYGESDPSSTVIGYPWLRHYYLGITSVDQIEFFPDDDFQNGQIEESFHNRCDNSYKKYQEYIYNRISFKTNNVQANNAAICNSWWSSQTKLKFFVVDSGGISVTDSMLVNNSIPFNSMPEPYQNEFQGAIELEEY